MEANELRIGSYVMDRDGKVFQIDHWERKDKVSANPPEFTKNFFGGHPMTEYIEYLQPIPLTEQWLLDFGFKKINRIDIGELKPCFAEFSFAVMIRHNSYFIDWIGGNTEVKHVDQLQTIYFALTGKELTLKQK